MQRECKLYIVMPSVRCSTSGLWSWTTTVLPSLMRTEWLKLEYWFYEILWNNIVKEYLLLWRRVSQLMLGVHFSKKHKKIISNLVFSYLIFLLEPLCFQNNTIRNTSGASWSKQCITWAPRADRLRDLRPISTKYYKFKKSFFFSKWSLTIWYSGNNSKEYM